LVTLQAYDGVKLRNVTGGSQVYKVNQVSKVKKAALVLTEHKAQCPAFIVTNTGYAGFDFYCDLNVLHY